MNIHKDDFTTIVQEKKDCGNAILAITALKEAADLLKDDDNNISMFLLLLAKQLAEKLLSEEQASLINKTKDLVDNLKEQ